MALIEPRFEASPRELRQFTALWLPAAFLVFGGVAWFWSGALRIPAVLWSVGLVLGLSGTLFPTLGRVLFLTWMTLTYPVGWALSHLLFALIYFGVMTPIGLVLRALSRDALDRRFDRAASSYWIERPRTDDVDGYFRRF